MQNHFVYILFNSVQHTWQSNGGRNCQELKEIMLEVTVGSRRNALSAQQTPELHWWGDSGVTISICSKIRRAEKWFVFPSL